MQNLHFEIDHINILKEVSDDQLAIAEVYVCHDGMNHHEKPISIETMRRAMSTLLNKFLVASFDGWDFGGHDGNKMGIIGFFPHENDLKIVEKEGRNYLVANAIISKNYASWAYDIFKRKDTKDVSMEISVLETQVKDDGYEWITEFVFNAVTVLGNTHNPACEGSQVQVFKFSTDELLEKGEKAYKDFTFASRYDGIDFYIPKTVKENAQSGLDLRKEYGRGGTSVGMNTARYLVSNSEISPEKVRHVAKYFPRHQGDNLDDKTSNGWIAWCLSEDTEILMSDGSVKTAKEICDNKIDDYVVSYNTETKRFENKKIVNWFINDSSVEDFYVIGKNKQNRRGISNKTKIHITGEHPFYSGNEWVEAKDMNGRNFYTIDNKPDSVSEEILRGILLGDGSIDSDRVTISHSVKQEDYTKEIGRLLGDFTSSIQTTKGNFKGFSNGTDIISVRTKSASYIESLKKELYIDGKKVVTKEYLNTLSDVSIAFWICDDGSLHKTQNKNSISYNYRLHIEGFDYESCLNIVDYFKNMGIETYLVKRENCEGHCLYFTHLGSLKLFERIGRYIPESMNYKKINETEYNYDLYNHVAHSEFLLSEESVKVFDKLSNFERHTANKKKHSKKYNFTVEDNNNYFANGMLVHNCLWGGDEGWSWSQRLVNKMEDIDNQKFAVDEVFETTESITIENSKDSAINSDSGSEQQTYTKKHDKELGLDTKNFEKEVGALNKQEMMEKMGCNMEGYEAIDMNYEEKMIYAVEKDSKKLFALPFEESEDGEFSMKMEDKKMMKMSYKFEEKSDEEDDSEVYMAMAKLMKYNTDQNVEAVGQTEQSKEEDEDLKEKAEESEENDEFEKMKSEFEDLKAKFESQTEEMESLKTFKKTTEEKEMMARVEFEISLVSEDMPTEKVSEWTNNVSSFETVDAWANALKADAYTFSKTKEKKETVIRTPFEFGQETKTKNFWEY